MTSSQDIVDNSDVLAEFGVNTHSHRPVESAVEYPCFRNSSIEVSVLEVDSSIERVFLASIDELDSNQ